VKSKRQELILRAVETGTISTQEQLLEYLLAQGFHATQATVSRDMKDLGLRKYKRDGKTFYVTQNESESRAQQYRAFLMSAVLGVDGAGNMVCVRCGAGMAQAVCAALDALPPQGVLGSLAGEDTIFLLCRTEADMQAVREQLSRYTTLQEEEE